MKQTNKLLSCQEHATLIFYLCQPTVTLHQGQGHQNENEHVRHPQVYHQAKFECNSLHNIVWDFWKLKVVKFEIHLHTHTRVVYLKIYNCHLRLCKQLVSPTSFCSHQWNGNVMSNWPASVIVKLRHCLDIKSSLGKTALTEQTPYTSYMRRSCDHNSRWRVLTLSHLSRTYRGLQLQPV